MKVQCIAELPTENQTKQLGALYIPGRQVFGLSVGREYVVLGIQIWDGAPWVEIASDYTDDIEHAPLCLFKITDSRPSKYWEIRITDEQDITMWPNSFYKDYYHDDLIEDVPEVVADFKKIKKLIEEEANTLPDGSHIEDF